MQKLPEDRVWQQRMTLKVSHTHTLQWRIS